MMRKKNENTLGRALVKNRFGSNKRRKNDRDTYLHSVDISDGYEGINLQSVTEESAFAEFLATAELADTDFQAEKLNVKFINPRCDIVSKKKQEQILALQEKNKELLRIPRRPKWDKTTTPQELQLKEKEEFLDWRRSLAALQETEDLLLTPYEKNLEFWRQLWRVLERSDVVVQIVDARNPLLFRCEDLEKYVKELSENKLNMILINKADYLTETQREIWAKYFDEINVRVAFFSATLAAQKIEDLHELEEENLNSDDNTEANDEKDESETDDVTAEKIKKIKISENSNNQENKEDINESVSQTSNNKPDLLCRDELIKLFRNIYPKEHCKNGVTSIGFVGYPNVGKSSTINALLMDKKTSVSNTPGKTKHFQSLFLEKDLMLYDCPGLVMPSFVNTKAEMILNGIFPINQMTDHVPPVTLLGTLIPKHIIEEQYGIMIPLPKEGEDPDRSPTSEEILNAHGCNRGFMTQNGQPDNARSARYILKDFVTGKLLYCKAPPGYEQNEFHHFPDPKKTLKSTSESMDDVKVSTKSKPQTNDVDKNFFQNMMGVHIRGRKNVSHQAESDSLTSEIKSDAGLYNIEKPWKKINKHANKKKREKARRLYAHHDQH